MNSQQLAIEKEGAKEEGFKGQHHQQDTDLSEDGLECVGQDSQDQRGLYELGYLQEFEEIDYTDRAKPKAKCWHFLDLLGCEELNVNWEEGEKINNIQGVLEELLFVWAEAKPH